MKTIIVVAAWNDYESFKEKPQQKLSPRFRGNNVSDRLFGPDWNPLLRSFQNLQVNFWYVRQLQSSRKKQGMYEWMSSFLVYNVP